MQNFYARRQERNRRKVDVDLVLQLVARERRIQPRLGARKVYHLIGRELKEAGVKIGRDRFFLELKKAGLLVEKKRSKWPKTTHFSPNLPVFKNRIKRVKLTGPNQVWIVDITYLRTVQTFLFLSLVSDKYSRKIVGHHLSDSLETGSSLKALRMALKGLRRGENPIHHSDRGCQYASHVYVRELRAAGLSISMTEINHCAENAQAERVNGILKQEYGLDEEFETEKMALKTTNQAIYLFNNRRPHDSLKKKTPNFVHSLRA